MALNKQNWLTTENKVRILEWKIRVDLVQYAARGCPKLDFDAVVNYIPLDSSPVASPSGTDHKGTLIAVHAALLGPTLTKILSRTAAETTGNRGRRPCHQARPRHISMQADLEKV